MADSKQLGMAGARALESSGQVEAALREYIRLRQPAEASRVAARLGQPRLAARLLADAGFFYQAALCYERAADPRASLECICLVALDDPCYLEACVWAARLLASGGELSFQVVRFLAPLIEGEPQSALEMEAFLLLADAHQREGRAEVAATLLSKVVARDPGFRDAATRLAALAPHAAEPPRALPAAGQRAEPLLPDLPPLPSPSPLLSSGRPRLSPPLASSRSPSSPPGPASSSLRSSPLRSSLPSSPPSPSWAAESGQPPGSPSPISVIRTTPGKPLPYAGPAAIGSPHGTIPPGTVIAERYRLEQQLGKGGMGVVYRATDFELGEEVAIKLFVSPLDDEQLLARFRQELLLARQLAHPNIVRVYDIGTHASMRYITMELLAGHDLRSELGQPLPLLRGLDLLIQAARGVGAAHAAGVVHRDLKPENLFITDGDVVKVMDFGIAKRLRAPGMTSAGFVLGTPEYMSPEQITNPGKVGTAADVYSLGVVAYEVFAGVLPFSHAETIPLLMMQATEPPPQPSQANPAIPPDLELVILALLEKDPEWRLASCAEMERQLGRVRQRLLAG